MQWLHTVVLQPLARDLDAIRREMTSLTSQVLQSAAVQLREEERSLLRSVERSPTMAFDFLVDRFPGRPECERWKQLAKYTRVRPTASPDSAQSALYSFHRLLQLGQRDGLSLYLWNSGAAIDGREWAPPLPSDAALACHAFWTFLSDFHPLVASTHFVDEGVAMADAKMGKVTRVAVMHQCRSWTLAPYYMLLVEADAAAGKGAEEAREWRCEPGRSNLFQAVALFVWVIKTRAGGRIGSIRLKDRALEGLADLVD